LRELPGLKFRALIPTGATASDSSLRGRELIWTAAEPPTLSTEGPPQATQIFSPNSEPPSVKVLPMPESILDHPDGVEAVPKADPEPQVLAGDSPALGKQPINLRSPVMKRSLAVAGGVIVLSVAVGMYAHYHRPSVVDRTPGSQQLPPQPTDVPPEKIPAVSSQGPETSAPPVEAPPVETRPAQKPKPSKIQAEKPVKAGLSDFSAKDIPFLLRKAEQDAGAGSYDAARREYKIVLQLDPNNPSAKQGLHRLELSR